MANIRGPVWVPVRVWHLAEKKNPIAPTKTYSEIIPFAPFTILGASSLQLALQMDSVNEKKKQEEDLKSSQKGATGDACRVRVTKKTPKQNTTVRCFLPLRPTHTHASFPTLPTHTQTLYTPPRSVLVDVYSWPDQITCDTGMKSGQAQSFSLHLSSLFLWPSLSHKS